MRMKMIYIIYHHDVIIYEEQQLWGGLGVRKEETMKTRKIQIAKGCGAGDHGVDDDDSRVPQLTCIWMSDFQEQVGWGS